MSIEKCTLTQRTATQSLKRMRRLFIYILHLKKSKMLLIMKCILIPVVKMCVCGGGNGHLELMKYGKFST